MLIKFFSSFFVEEKFDLNLKQANFIFFFLAEILISATKKLKPTVSFSFWGLRNARTILQERPCFVYRLL